MGIADRQHGVITRGQLEALGLSAAAVTRWARNGRLRRMYPGVYAVGHAVLVPDGRRLAAVLACGGDAVLSHCDAGAVWNVCAARGGRFHVTVPPDGARRGRRAGVHVHESALRPEDWTVRNGIPVTSLARTLVDIAAVSTEAQVAEAVDAAVAQGLYDQAAIDAVTGRGRAGSARLKKVIAKRHPASHDGRSGWERAMLRLLDAHDLPRPEVNAALPDSPLVPDLLWRTDRLVVAWDSWAHHSSPESFEGDRAKTVALQLLGYTVLRFTWKQTRQEPERVVGAIRRFLT